MRNRFVITPADILAVASLLLNILVIGFAVTTHSIWYIFLAFTLPLLWWSLMEVSREGSDTKS